jgi:dienelactone hydrolase
MPTKTRNLILLAIAAVLAIVSVLNLVAAGNGITRRAETINGVPVEIFTPANASGPLPAVLVVHGFSGNKQLMYGFGYTLARNGYAAALIDFAGHGASLDRLPNDPAGDAQYIKLAGNIDTALGWLRQQSFADPARIAILGHSMGASAVARFGSEHSDVPVTIALSLGNFGAQLPNDPSQPRNFLIQVGANEFAGFVQGSTAGLTVAYPQGVAGQTYGDFAQGSARRLVLVPGVEHITILFSHDTYREMLRWLDAAFGVAAPDRPLQFDSRMGWVLLFYLASAIAFLPLAKWVLRVFGFAAQADTGKPAVTGVRVILMTLMAAVLAVIVLRLDWLPYRWVPLTVGNYVGAFFLLHGLVAGAYVWAQQRYTPLPAKAGITFQPASLKPLVPVLLLTAYALVTFGVPAHLAWNNFALAGDRAWIMLVLFVCCFVFFWADEMLVARASRRARLGLYAATKIIVLVALMVAVFFLGAPGFLLLLLPVMVVLFLWFGLYSHWLYGLTRAPWAGALLNAAVFAWVISATFALVSY